MTFAPEWETKPCAHPVVAKYDIPFEKVRSQIYALQVFRLYRRFAFIGILKAQQILLHNTRIYSVQIRSRRIQG